MCLQLSVGSVLSAQGRLLGAALAFSGAAMRTRIYVDGFNLYYGALEGTPFKWLDPVRLTALLLPRGHSIEKQRCFTARVSGISDPGAPARQQIYLKALATLPEVDLHCGSFLAKTTWRPLANLPVAGRRIDAPNPVTLPKGEHPILGARRQTLPVGVYPAKRAGRKGGRRRAAAPVSDAVITEFHTMEEKGSDVNLAANLLNDTWKGLFDAAVVVSNDTDLVTPVRVVTSERKRPVFVVCPGRWQLAPKLRNAASHLRHVRPAMPRAAQFPDTLPGTAISKPDGW